MKNLSKRLAYLSLMAVSFQCFAMNETKEITSIQSPFVDDFLITVTADPLIGGRMGSIGQHEGISQFVSFGLSGGKAVLLRPIPIIARGTNYQLIVTTLEKNVTTRLTNSQLLEINAAKNLGKKNTLIIDESGKPTIVPEK